MDESSDRYRVLAENATDVVWQTTLDGVWVWISPSVFDLLGWRPDELIGSRVFDFVHPDDHLDGEISREKMAAGERVTQEARIRSADGTYRWVSGMGKEIHDEHGTVIGRTGGWRDIQAEVLTRQELAASNEKYRLLAENAADLIWQSNADGVIQWVSPSIESVLGWRPSEVLGHQSLEFINVMDQAEVLRLRELLLQGHPVTRWQGRYRCSDGNFRWMSVQVRPVMDPRRRVVGMVVGLRDVHQEVLAREALARSERKFRLALDGAPQGMAIVNLNRQFTTVNDALCRMVDRDRSWLLDHTLADLLSAQDNELDLASRDSLLAGEADNDTHEIRFMRPNGEVLWVNHSISLLRDEDNIPLFYVSQYQDITEARRIRSQLAYQAGHDVLTGLLNRSEFMAEIERFRARKVRGGKRMALMFCDIDRFKEINDSHGHPAGDLVLKEVAERIRESLRSHDLVARLGGDEFVILIDGVGDDSDASRTADKIRAAVGAELRIDGIEAALAVQVSIGVWVGDQTEEPEHMMAKADQALYRAKDSGRNRTELADDPAGANELNGLASDARVPD